MSNDTVKPKVPAQRAKKTVETTTDFDAFTRRILRAYGRRVADGDIEALRSLAVLATTIDAVTRAAVTGLRQEPHAYSWAEIAARLGVTRQAAQMRYGKPETEQAAQGEPDQVRLDQRLIDAGLGVTVPTLVAVFADHHPGIPQARTCPGCGYRYPQGQSDCPTNATVRPLLTARRAEDFPALAVLTPDQLTDLHSQTTARTNRTAARRSAHPTPSPDRADTLLDLLHREDSTS